MQLELRSGHALMAQQGVDVGLASPKGLERFHGGPAAARFQNRLHGIFYRFATFGKPSMAAAVSSKAA